MSGLDMRGLKVSKPVLGLLVVTLGLIAFAYWRDARDDTADVDMAAQETPASAGLQPIQGPAPGGVSAVVPMQSMEAPQAMQAMQAMQAVERSPVDVFPSQSWLPPPPPAAPPSAATAGASPTEAPPLPFVVRSLWLDPDGSLYIVLSASNSEFALCTRCQKKGFLRKGDVLLNAWRIEDINSRSVRFVYLPMKRRQQLSLGAGR